MATLKVVYRNPNPSGGNVYFIDNVIHWTTRNHELHIWTKGYDYKTEPAPISFAQGEWICTELQESKDVPVRRDRHHVDNEDYVEQDIPDRVRKEYAEGRATVPTDRPRHNGGRPRPSNLTDLAYSTPDDVERTQVASVQFAIDNMKVPWSEAHMRALFDFERSVAQEYGEDAVHKLPWNMVPRGDDFDRKR